MAAQPVLNLDFPQEFEYLFQPARYKVAHGGRGSAKSWSYARALIQRAVERPERILCCRELQNSISESVHRLLSDQIEEMGYGRLFEVQQNTIYRRPYGTETGKQRGAEFFFYGIKNNTNKIKSAEGITICWCEEAEKISAGSWEILIPTIRQPGSEIWVSFNPDEENDPTYQRFVVSTPPDAVVREVNWHQNPWFPDVLRKEMEYLRKVDPEAYEHVWNGQCRRNLSSQIFRGKYSIQAFTIPDASHCTKDNPMWEGPYFGADWGYANDPTVLTKTWIDSKARRLMVEYESWGVGVEMEAIAPKWKRDVPGCENYVIRADNSRPETISYVARNGQLRVQAAEKWKGSVEDGIAYLKNFTEIVFHPRCERHIQEAKFYSYKVEKLTGDVLAEVIDKWNHCWDADRYGHEPMIMSKSNLGIWARL